MQTHTTVTETIVASELRKGDHLLESTEKDGTSRSGFDVVDVNTGTKYTRVTVAGRKVAFVFIPGAPVIVQRTVETEEYKEGQRQAMTLRIAADKYQAAVGRPASIRAEMAEKLAEGGWGATAERMARYMEALAKAEAVEALWLEIGEHLNYHGDLEAALAHGTGKAAISMAARNTATWSGAGFSNAVESVRRDTAIKFMEHGVWGF